VASAVEDYSRGHRAFPVVAYYRIGSTRRPPDLPGGGGRPRVYKKYIAPAGCGKKLDYGAKLYDAQRGSIRSDFIQIKDEHPSITNVLLASSLEGGTAGVYLARPTDERTGSGNYRILDDLVECMGARKIWVVALGPQSNKASKVLRDNARRSLDTLRDFATGGRKKWPPIGINVTYVTREQVSKDRSEQPKLVGRAVATILDTPSGYRELGTGGLGRSATYQPAMNPADLASHLCHWNSQEAASEDSAQPISLGDNLVSTPWSVLCFNTVKTQTLSARTDDASALYQQLIEQSMEVPWIEMPRVFSWSEQPNGIQMMNVLVITTCQNEQAADGNFTDQLSISSLRALKMRCRCVPTAEVGGVWNNDRSFRNQSIVTLLVRGVEIKIDGLRQPGEGPNPAQMA